MNVIDHNNISNIMNTNTDNQATTMGQQQLPEGEDIILPGTDEVGKEQWAAAAAAGAAVVVTTKLLA